MAIESKPFGPENSKPPRWTSPLSFFGLSVFRLFIFTILVLCVPTRVHANTLTGCVNQYDPAMDYFPDKINERYAEDFDIEYHLNYKILINQRTNETFCLYQCGTPAPTNLANTTKIFPVPFSSLAITSTVEIPFLELLGLRSKIKFISYPQYVTSPCIQQTVLNGNILALSTNASIQAEQVASVDGIFEYSANRANNKSISVSTSQDPGTLHRVSWIGFMAAFFNQEKKANDVFTTISTRYACVSAWAKSFPGSPKIAWVDYYQKYQIDVADYKIQFITDLGATPVAPAVHTFTNVMDWQAAVADVDIIIDETYNGDINTFYSTFNLSSSSTQFKFIAKGQIWRFDKLQSDFEGLDWFEGAVANADAVLEDLLTIAKPEAKFPHTRVWFRNSYYGEAIVVEGASKCADVNAPGSLVSGECTPYTPTTAVPTTTTSSAMGLQVRWVISVILSLCLAVVFTAL